MREHTAALQLRDELKPQGEGLTTSICLRTLCIFHCWFQRESITTGHVLFIYFSKGLKQMEVQVGRRIGRISSSLRMRLLYNGFLF